MNTVPTTPTTTTYEPFYRDGEQFRARAVHDEDIACWEESARASISTMIPGGVNWPMIVRSLVAEVRRLRQERQ